MIRVLMLLFLLTTLSCNPDSEETKIEVYTADFSVAVNENQEAGAIIGKVSGTTNQGKVTFELISQSPENSLVLNESTGELRVLEPANFDYEINPVISGQFKVLNDMTTATASIRVELIDVIEKLNIYEGDVVLASQEEVDEFGSKNYDEINGSLHITNLYSTGKLISSLTPLATIKKVEDLHLRNLQALGNLSGLDNLQEIKGGFYVISCPFVNLDELENLNSIGGDFQLSNNQRLVDIKGLHNINQVGSKFNISFNESLLNLDGLKNLISIGGNLEITRNSSLETLSGLSSLTSIGGHLIKIDDNPEIESLDGLASVKSLGGDSVSYYATIDIISNNKLANIDGLSGLNNYSGWLGTDAPFIRILSNSSLVNIDGLQNITKALYININSNHRLENLNGLKNLALIDQYLDTGNLDIRNNTVLDDFCGLTTLIEKKGYVEGAITISKNAYNPSPNDILGGNCAK